jgi:Antitoxin-like ribbon-helix-helix
VPAERNSLQAVLDRQTQTAPPPNAEARPARARDPGGAKFFRPSREGRRLIAGHFDPSVAKHLKLLAAEEDTTVQALLEEALELLFLKKGQGTIRNV